MKRIFPKLASGRSARWALMEKFEVPNYDGPGNYLTRWRVVQTPWFGLYLHRLDGPDPRATLHDHPWNFLSIVLRGGYIERRLNRVTMEVDEARQVGRFNLVRAHDCHAIMRLDRSPTWTLLLVGRRQRTWGYVEPVGNMGGVRVPFEDPPLYVVWRWTEFNKHHHAHEFDAAMARRKAAS